MLRIPGLALVVLALAVECCAQGKAKIIRSTEPMECSELRAGQSVTHKTGVLANKTDSVHFYATATLTRDRQPKTESCTATYRFFVSLGKDPFRAVKSLSNQQNEELVGVDLVGFSKDESKLAVNFWWAEGDYTGHRPVIFDIRTSTARLRELNEEITAQLPSCDYFQVFDSVSNSGKAIIHVPKSQYVDEGCPDQGDWSFDLDTGEVHKLKGK